MKQIKTLKGLIRYLFYMDNDKKLQFGFNECWEPEKDKEISKELIEEIKIICPKLMDIDVEYDALNVEEKQGKLCNDCGRIMGTNKECWLCNKFNDALNVKEVSV